MLAHVNRFVFFTPGLEEKSSSLLTRMPSGTDQSDNVRGRGAARGNSLRRSSTNSNGSNITTDATSTTTPLSSANITIEFVDSQAPNVRSAIQRHTAYHSAAQRREARSRRLRQATQPRYLEWSRRHPPDREVAEQSTSSRSSVSISPARPSSQAPSSLIRRTSSNETQTAFWTNEATTDISNSDGYFAASTGINHEEGIILEHCEYTGHILLSHSLYTGSGCRWGEAPS
jgi:hypothetical protein